MDIADWRACFSVLMLYEHWINNPWSWVCNGNENWCTTSDLHRYDIHLEKQIWKSIHRTQLGSTPDAVDTTLHLHITALPNFSPAPEEFILPTIEDYQKKFPLEWREDWSNTYAANSCEIVNGGQEDNLRNLEYTFQES